MKVAPRQPLVAQRLLALREDLGISQEEAVARTDGAVTLRQWQRWEKGESEPYKRNIAKLSDVFSIPISDFFEQKAEDDTQLDRIERMLLEVLSRLPELDEEIEQELDDALLQADEPSTNNDLAGHTQGPQVASR